MMSYSFVNPYNFMPLPTDKGRADKKGTLSGVIEYKLYTKTPLFIPDTSNDHAFAKEGDVEEHKSYDFFSYTDPRRPVIPGSEIRGVLRSNYEMVTDSCLSSLDTRAVLSKRTMESFRAGLLKKTKAGEKPEFDLYKAEDCLWRTHGKNSQADELNWKKYDKSFKERECYIQDDMPEGTKVAFQYIQRQGYDNKGKLRTYKPLARNVLTYKNGMKVLKGCSFGYLIKGAVSPGSHNGDSGVTDTQKHCAHIFLEPDSKSKPVLQDVATECLDTVLKIYHDNNGNDTQKNYQEYSDNWKAFKKDSPVGEYFPVYYSLIKDKDRQLLYLSPACKTRELYQVNLRDLAGKLKPCSNTGQLCPACSLFGTLTEDGSAVSSRIRVLDVQAEEKESSSDYYLKTVTLKPLSSPKLSNVEFYLKRPERQGRPDLADFWTYEYYVDAQGNTHIHNGTLAGRKFYWHNLAAAKRADIYSMEKGERNSQNITVRPVKPGVTFPKGKIYFENLSQKELDTLLFVIRAEDDEPVKTKRHGLKLGAAKPLGFGSVAIEVTGVTIREYKRDDDAGKIVVTDKPYKPGQAKIQDKKEQQFLKITDFYAVKNMNIDYPKTKADDEGYVWFTKNHAGFDRRKRKDLGMPNARSQMILRQYMEAMEPKLRDNTNHSANNNRLQYKGNQAQNKSINKKAANTPAPGEKMTATVIGFSKSKNRNIKIQIQQGQGMIYSEGLSAEQIPKEGDRIEVAFSKRVGSTDIYTLV